MRKELSYYTWENNWGLKTYAIYFFGVTNYRIYQYLDEPDRSKKNQKDIILEISKQYVYEFLHEDECSRIDANHFKFNMSREEKCQPPYGIMCFSPVYCRFFLNSDACCKH